jgi:prepilin-type N-terminal cleavage/methylation domain-containing protein
MNRKMKNLKLNQKRYKGFTLVELLVVIVIIAVLMGMLIPAVMRAKVRARIATARADMSNIKGAILSYQTDYSRFPVPRPKWVRTYLPSTHELAPSFGLLTPSPWHVDAATGLYDPPLPTWALNPSGGDITFGDASTPNYGVMRILCSVDDSFSRPVPANSPTGLWPISDLAPSLTVNGNYSRNPKKNKYLDVPSGDDLGDSGLDPIYNFNDPFGQQYIITMDMDGDGDCSDKYYRQTSMNVDVVIGLRKSKWTPTPPLGWPPQMNSFGVWTPTPPPGWSPGDIWPALPLPSPPHSRVNVLAVNQMTEQWRAATVLSSPLPPPPLPEHALMGSVMIYSRGPDQKARGDVPALQGVNEDNILDWK